jgi:hypothetical protein
MTELLSYITYPRFVTAGQDLLFTFRTGKAGLGDDHLCVYKASPSLSSSSSPSTNTGGEPVGTQEVVTGTYTFLGTHLKGVSNNPYINGLSATPSPSPHGLRLTTTWVYREFVPYAGWDDPLDIKHKTQAGPNSAFNNRDLCYAWSEDGGLSWRSGPEGTVIAELGKGESIVPSSPDIIAFEIPKGSGLINQEAQVVDRGGGVHVLNRDNMDGGVQRWKHYYLDPCSEFQRVLYFYRFFIYF